eukprot:5843383-Ditylum_brightwellii.AAC.3
MVDEFKQWHTPENVKQFWEGKKGNFAKKLQTIFDAASAALSGSPPSTVDYQKYPNPYMARYDKER